MPNAFRRTACAVLAASALLLLTAGCRTSTSGAAAPPSTATTGARLPPSATPTPSPSPSPSPTPSRPDPAAVRANELGSVPILMFHQVVAQPKGVYDMTPAAFRAQLERLVRERYYPVTAAELTTRRMDVPAGWSPVVLTFDDATTSQLTLTAAGAVDPRCAVGILLDVARRHPGWRATATMYVNELPFARRDGKALQVLRGLGFELGDHTVHHVNLKRLSAAAAEAEIAGGQKIITDALPGYHVLTLALPLGVHPRQRSLALRGKGYSFAAVMLVGAGPARSPFSVGWDPLGVPRMRSGTRLGAELHQDVPDTTHWLDDLARHPERRFVSDGAPATVSFPRALAGRLDPKWAAVARPY